MKKSNHDQEQEKRKPVKLKTLVVVGAGICMILLLIQVFAHTLGMEELCELPMDHSTLNLSSSKVDHPPIPASWSPGSPYPATSSEKGTFTQHFAWTPGSNQKLPRGDCAMLKLKLLDGGSFRIKTAKEEFGPKTLPPLCMTHIWMTHISINSDDKYAKITVTAPSVVYELVNGSVEVLTEKDPKKKGQTKEITLLLTCKNK